MYLKQMGQVPLLTREQEVEISKRGGTRPAVNVRTGAAGARRVSRRAAGSAFRAGHATGSNRTMISGTSDKQQAEQS